MYIETVPNRNSPPAVLLREGWREGNKTRKRTLANLSHSPQPKIDTFRRLLQDEPPCLSPSFCSPPKKLCLTAMSKPSSPRSANSAWML
jgi:hypothetical protein